MTGRGAAPLRRAADARRRRRPEITYSDLHWLARQVAAAGAAAHVLDPPDLVEAVVARLRAAAGVVTVP